MPNAERTCTMDPVGLRRYLRALDRSLYDCLGLLLEDGRHDLLTVFHEALDARAVSLGMPPYTGNNINSFGSDYRWGLAQKAKREAKKAAADGARCLSGRIVRDAVFNMEYGIQKEMLRVLLRAAFETPTTALPTALAVIEAATGTMHEAMRVLLPAAPSTQAAAAA